MSTYVTVDAYENVRLRCDEHPRFEKLLDEGSSMAGIAAIVEAHNEHVAEGCGSELVFLQ